jgi:O-acetylhomoserine (thiol)-lyase
MNTPTLHLNTRLIHGAYEAEPVTGATVPPVFQSTAFAYDTAEELEAVFAGREAGYVYSRIANPTLTAFERRLTALEEGLGAVACASGMAAISATVLALAGQGDEIVSGHSLFGGTYSLFQQTLSRYGITTRFVETTDVAAYRAAINERTKLVFVETIGNPKLDVPDLAALAAVTCDHGVALAVDSTVTTPFLVQPKVLGADLVIHSTSKFISGHGHAIGGMIVDSGTFDWANRRYSHLSALRKRAGNFVLLAYLRNQICRDLGCCLSPFNAFLLTMGLESLGVRMERHCANALRVAEFLVADPRVGEVRYPGLASHPDQAVARRQFHGGYGAVLTLRLGDKPRAFKFINGLRRATRAANLGDARTLVIHPASTFCREWDEPARKAMGVSEDLVRFSIGLEHADDIIHDIAASLGQL